MVYLGDAKPQNGSITFNNDQLGWATYAQKLLLYDHTTSSHLSNFETHFSFLIKNNNQTNSNLHHSHGFAFFLAQSEFNPSFNSSRSLLGLFNSPTQNAQIFHVEFDTFPNPEWDPPFQHIGINKNSISSSIYSPWNSSTDHHHHEKKKITHVWISYNATAKTLSVSLNHNEATISHQIDLMEILPEKVTIGFAASMEDLIIETWEFISNYSDANYQERDEKEINRNLLAVLIAWGGVLVIAIISIYLISVIRSEREKKEKYQDQHGSVMKLASIYSDLNKEASSPRRFSYQYLAMATDNFSVKGKLGQGGYGAVFEGNLPGANKKVAVKKIFKGSTQGKREYISEVKIISRMKHKNLVQLIGWCHEKDNNSEFLLVYEFMPNGSLDSHLFGKNPPLSWPLRCVKFTTIYTRKFKLICTYVMKINMKSIYLSDVWDILHMFFIMVVVLSSLF